MWNCGLSAMVAIVYTGILTYNNVWLTPPPPPPLCLYCCVPDNLINLQKCQSSFWEVKSYSEIYICITVGTFSGACPDFDQYYPSRSQMTSRYDNLKNISQDLYLRYLLITRAWPRKAIKYSRFYYEFS